jgi:hypothetical protein
MSNVNFKWNKCTQNNVTTWGDKWRSIYPFCPKVSWWYFGYIEINSYMPVFLSLWPPLVDQGQSNNSKFWLIKIKQTHMKPIQFSVPVVLVQCNCCWDKALKSEGFHHSVISFCLSPVCLSSQNFATLGLTIKFPGFPKILFGGFCISCLFPPYFGNPSTGISGKPRHFATLVSPMEELLRLRMSRLALRGRRCPSSASFIYSIESLGKPCSSLCRMELTGTQHIIAH